jgi:hypothetical protein
MTVFANAADFNNPSSRMAALGTDFAAQNAIVDPFGKVLAYARTGGMLSPVRHELQAGATIYRFGRSNLPASRVMSGAWWIDREGFEKLVAFANVHSVELPMAVRALCLLPPEWSDLGMLVRARLRKPLLAWRGLANSVVTRASDGLGNVRLDQFNDISARRLYQLYIPGLDGRGGDSLAVERTWAFSKDAGMKGWLYL